jgi:integrase
MENGIVFRRGEDGDGTFSVNIMVDRRRVHRVVGRESEGVTRKQVEDFVAQLRTDARRDRLELPEGRKTPLSFTEAAERYVTLLEQEEGKNLKAKRRQLQQHLRPFFGTRTLASLTSFEIERYKRHRSSSGAAPATINRELAVLSHTFNKAVDWKWLKSRPTRIRRNKEDNRRIVYLTQPQCDQLLRAAEQDQNGNVHAFIMVALATGMRHSEILKIRRHEVDLEKRCIWIPKAKAGAREQPITQELAEYLDQRLKMLPSGCEWIFPSLGSRAGHGHTIRKAFRRSVARAGLDPDVVTPHVLRHTVVTHLVQAGVDLPTVQRISGHKTLTMVARYAHQSGSHIEAAMSKLQNRLSPTDVTRSLKREA